MCMNYKTYILLLMKRNYYFKKYIMKYIFRGYTVFEYNPTLPIYRCGDMVTLNKIDELGGIPAFDYCNFISEDFKLISQFFDIVYRHINGEDVELKDIVVY